MPNFLGSPITELHRTDDALALALNELAARRRVLVVAPTHYEAGVLMAETLCQPAFHGITPALRPRRAGGALHIGYADDATPGLVSFTGRGDRWEAVRGRSADTLVLFDVRPRDLNGDEHGPASAVPVLATSSRHRLILVNAS